MLREILKSLIIHTHPTYQVDKIEACFAYELDQTIKKITKLLPKERKLLCGAPSLGIHTSGYNQALVAVKKALGIEEEK